MAKQNATGSFLGAKEKAQIVQLAEMRGAELNSLLLEVMAARAVPETVASIAAKSREHQLVNPSGLDQRALLAVDSLAYAVLPDDFAGIDLSPVVPMGTNTVLGGVSQKNVLAALRGTEVLPDPTTALALEAAKRRQQLLAHDARDATIVHLATSSRSLRLQNVENIRGFLPHFRTFALTSAGRDVGHEAFEVETFGLHLRFYLNFLTRLSGLGHTATDIHVSVSDVRVMRKVVEQHGLSKASIGRESQADQDLFRKEKVLLPKSVASPSTVSTADRERYGATQPFLLLEKIEAEVIAQLGQEFPNVTFSYDLERCAGISYYANACFKIRASNRDGVQFPLADGGFVDWTQKLIVSRKERSLASGIGTELLCANF